ncbi:glycosyltransferase [Planctomicrobium sp. SH668]|uniref:glycosyltransferase n=1 Tax=Planctomicrobium sp. SH668 TaxID=3448126 RepID=UPI003F5BB305
MTSNRLKRVLFVSYLFPPTGGVGVHRVTKFVKFLPAWDWASSVLTVSNPSVPLKDDSLLNDIPDGTIIRRAKTFEPDYSVKNSVSGGGSSTGKSNTLVRAAKSCIRRVANTALQPDPQILWRPQALKAGLKLLKEVPHDVIVATGPPFSSLVLGATLSKKTGIPLILDYRDEWDISNEYWENKGQGRLANWIQNRQQRFALKHAKLVLATTPSSAAAILNFSLSVGGTDNAACIYNGFDPDDYSGKGDAESVAKLAPIVRPFRLAFIGTLWNLNSVQPVVDALRKLSIENPHLAEEMEFLLAGRRMPDQEAILDQLNDTPIKVTRLPFISHPQAISLMQTAQALLMINSDLPKTQRIINAKTFEYMAAKRPMFVVAPKGDVWDIVQDLPGAMLCTPSDVDGIALKLSLAMERNRCGFHDNDAIWPIQHFERKHLAGQLASLMNELVPDSNDIERSLCSPSNGDHSERSNPEW